MSELADVSPDLGYWLRSICLDQYEFCSCHFFKMYFKTWLGLYIDFIRLIQKVDVLPVG